MSTLSPQHRTTSPILEELYRVRDEIAAEYNYDIVALAAALQRDQDQREREGTITVARLPIQRREGDMP
jgi:hypothetical protein